MAKKILNIMLLALFIAGCQIEKTVDPPAAPDPVDLPGTWERMADIPTEVQENSVAEMGGKLYLSGGMTNSDITGFLKHVYQYDPVSDTWTEFAEFDRQIHHHASASINGILYIIGGYSGPYPGGEMLDAVYSFDSTTGLWEQKASLPRPIAAGTAVSSGDEIYFFGGTLMFNTGRYNSDVLKYSPADNQWEKINSFPRTREHTSAVVLEDKIYIVGGRKYEGSFSTFPYLDAYDPVKNEWEQLPDIPVATSASLVAVLNRKIYTFGGEMAAGTSSFSMITRGYEYNPVTGQWREVENLAYHGTIAVTLGPGIFIAGGGNTAGIVNAKSTTFKFAISN